MYEHGNAPSAIRELFAYGMARKDQIGEDKVFDFSIGNPSVPAPDSVAETIRELADMAPAQLHAYSAAQGLESTRTAIAENLNKRFGTHYTADNLYLTMGAAACLSACFTALIEPGDEIIVIAPYFPEYRIWIEFAGGVCVEVPAREDNFQIDLDALEQAITEKTKAVVINTPNNPSAPSIRVKRSKASQTCSSKLSRSSIMISTSSPMSLIASLPMALKCRGSPRSIPTRWYVIPGRSRFLCQAIASAMCSFRTRSMIPAKSIWRYVALVVHLATFARRSSSSALSSAA